MLRFGSTERTVCLVSDIINVLGEDGTTRKSEYIYLKMTYIIGCLIEKMNCNTNILYSYNNVHHEVKVTTHYKETYKCTIFLIEI